MACEYCTTSCLPLEVQPGGRTDQRVYEPSLRRLDAHLAEMADEGWELVSVVLVPGFETTTSHELATQLFYWRRELARPPA